MTNNNYKHCYQIYFTIRENFCCNRGFCLAGGSSPVAEGDFEHPVDVQKGLERAAGSAPGALIALSRFPSAAQRLRRLAFRLGVSLKALHRSPFLTLHASRGEATASACAPLGSKKTFFGHAPQL